MSVILELVVETRPRGMLRCSSTAVMLMAQDATKGSAYNGKSVWSPAANLSVVVSSGNDLLGGRFQQDGLRRYHVSATKHHP
jgi:hypothetical protein